MPAKSTGKEASIFASAEAVAKLATAGFGMLYVLGFLVSNIQLMALGIADFSALQARNIMIGFLFVIYFSIFATILLPLAAMPWVYKRGSAETRKKQKYFFKMYGELGFLLLVFLIVAVLAGAWIGFFFPWGLSYYDLWLPNLLTAPDQQHIGTAYWQQFLDAFFHLDLIVPAFGTLAVEVALIDSMTSGNFKWREQGLLFLVAVVVTVVVLLAFLLYGYANNVYPNFKYNLGGGQPQIANLTLAGKKSEIAGLSFAGLPVHKILCCDEQTPPAASAAQPARTTDADEAASLTDVAIWYQSDKFIYIAGARNQMKSQVVAIDLKLVRSIHYLAEYVRVESGARIVVIQNR